MQIVLIEGNRTAYKVAGKQAKTLYGSPKAIYNV